MMTLGTNPSPCLFGVFADVGTASCLLVFSSPADALIGSALLALSGAFFAFYLPRRWLIAHMVFATALIVALAGLTILADGRDAWVTVIRAHVIIAVVLVSPLSVQLVWAQTTRKARFADIDYLTGLLNRRGMLNYVEQAMARGRPGSSVAAVVVDIDRFKNVNDTHGHAVGDTVITATAAVMAESIDGRGAVARTGGEEFTAIVIGSPRDVHAALDNIPTIIDCQGLPTVTVSAGVAVSVVVAGRAELVWHTIARADRFMYIAKREGGQRMRIADDGDCPSTEPPMSAATRGGRRDFADWRHGAVRGESPDALPVPLSGPGMSSDRTAR